MTFRPKAGPSVWLAILLVLGLVAIDAIMLAALSSRPIDVATVFSGLGLAISGFSLGLLGCWLYARARMSYHLDRNRLEIRGPYARHVIPIGAIQDIVSLASRPTLQSFQGFRRLGFLVGCGELEGIGRIWCCAMQLAGDFCHVVTQRGAYLISPACSAELRQAYEERKYLGPSQSVRQEVVRLQMPEVSVLRDNGALALVSAGLWLTVLVYAHVTLHVAYTGLGDISGGGTRMFQLALAGLLVWMVNSALGALLHRRQRPIAYLLFVASLLFGVMLLRIAFDAMPVGREVTLVYRLFAGVCLSGVVAMAGYKRFALSDSGALGALVVGTLVFGFGGWVWGLMLIGFFVTSSSLSRYRREEKEAAAAKFAKGSQRDLGQVLANGGIGAVLAILNHVQPAETWLPLYVGVMSAVTADTWATEFGVLSKGMPRMITTWKRVSAGTSGAISLRGSAASLLGGLFIGALALLLLAVDSLARRMGFLPASIWLPLVAAAGGTAGSLTDSLLGATLQGIYRCDQCDKETERRVHVCGQATTRVRGWAWLSNDWVNLISSLVGGGVALWVAQALT